MSRRQRELQKKVHEDLANRSFHGVWGQICVLLTLLLATHFPVRAPAFTYSATSLMLVQTTLRWFLLKRMDALYAGNPRRFEMSHAALILFCALFWGVVTSLAFWAYGPYDHDILVLYLCDAGISIGLVTIFVHDARLIRISLTLLYLPQIGTLVLASKNGEWKLAVTLLIYTLYLSAQGKKLSLAYWRQINDNYELATIARRDFLTSLPNRLYMEELLEASIASARGTGGQLALLYIDLDGFKQINDRFSHRIGDLFLCAIAARLTAGIQSEGIAARLGGDEFSILVTKCPSSKAAVDIAERVLRVAREPLSIEGHTFCVSASIGVSLFPGDGNAADHLVRAADHAMYAAKTSGKNQVCLFDALRDESSIPEEPAGCSLMLSGVA